MYRGYINNKMLVGVVRIIRIIWGLCVGTKFYNNKTYNLPSKYIHSYLNCNSNMLAFDIYRTRVPEPHRSPGCNKWLNLLFADKYKTSRQLDIILKDFLISPNKEKTPSPFGDSVFEKNILKDFTLFIPTLLLLPNLWNHDLNTLETTILEICNRTLQL